MLEVDLNEIVDADLMAAFRKMFAGDPDIARQELLEIMAMFANPSANRPAIADFAARVIFGLLPDVPHAASWFKAVAEGSFVLRPNQEYGRSQALRSRARLLERQSPLFLGNIQDLQGAWAKDVAAAQEGTLIILFTMIAQELRTNVAAKAALGPAWPLMVAVDGMKADQKRKLYWWGGDNRLHAMIAEAISEVLDDFHEFYGCAMEPAPAFGDWKRKLPPNADAQRFFQDRKADEPLGASCDSLTPSKVNDREPEPSTTTSHWHFRPETSKTFSYVRNVDGSPLDLSYDEQDLDRLKRMMPLLAKRTWTYEMTVAAAHAKVRHLVYSQEAEAMHGAVYQEIRRWVSANAPPPPTLLFIHARLFEEEICLRLLEGSPYLSKLQEIGLLRDFDAASLIPDAEMALVAESVDYIVKRRTQMKAARQPPE